jgi:HPt (histidine-containing phosphotransfer) domain-containing protein
MDSSTAVLDLDEAVSLLGNMQTVRRLLTSFVERYGGTASELRQAIDASDFQQARATLHTIIGVAGNLRLRELHERALALQAPVREGATDESRAQLVEFERAMNAARETIAALIREGEPATTSAGRKAGATGHTGAPGDTGAPSNTGTTGGTDAPADTDNTEALLRRLLDLLDRNSLDAQQACDRLGAALRDEGCVPTCSKPPRPSHGSTTRRPACRSKACAPR